MRRTVIATSWAICWLVQPLAAQDWSPVQALDRGTSIRVQESSSPGATIEGRLESVDGVQLTMVVRDRPIVIQRDTITRIDRTRRDRLWNGLAIGVGLTLGLRAAFGNEPCARTSEPRCTIQGLAVGAGIGAFVDSRIQERQTIYRAPQQSVAFLRFSF